MHEKRGQDTVVAKLRDDHGSVERAEVYREERFIERRPWLRCRWERIVEVFP